jgi:hypothetical protein
MSRRALFACAVAMLFALLPAGAQAAQLPAGAVVAAADTLSPELHSFGLSTRSVAVGSSYQDVVVWVDLTDDASGIDPAACQVQLRSPSGALATAVTPFTLVSGDSLAGTWSQTLRVPMNAEPGRWTADGTFRDLAGNYAVPVASNLVNIGQTYWVQVSDAPAPVDVVTAQVLSVTPQACASGTQVTLTGAATDSLGDAVTAYEWSSSLDGVLGTVSSPVFSTSGLSIGTHTIVLRAQCSNGTWSSPVAYGQVVVTAQPTDSVAPVTTSDAKSGYVGSAKVALAPSDLGGSGVAHTYYILDGGAVTEGRLVATSTLGGHTLSFWSVDGAGNVEHATTVRFTVSLPSATVSTPSAPSAVRHGTSFTVSGYVAPAHSSGTYLATLYCYRYQSGHYVLRKTVKARRYAYSSAKSRYSAMVSLPYAGRWRVRALHADPGHAASWSGYRYVTAR